MSEWTVDTLKEHFDALREADQRALLIKEEGDTKALNLAREIQTYKDEKANELREQINRERGLYATKDDLSAAMEKVEAVIKPLAEFVTAYGGRQAGISLSTGVLITGLTTLGVVMGIVAYLLS